MSWSLGIPKVHSTQPCVMILHPLARSEEGMLPGACSTALNVSLTLDPEFVVTVPYSA